MMMRTWQEREERIDLGDSYYTDSRCRSFCIVCGEAADYELDGEYYCFKHYEEAAIALWATVGEGDATGLGELFSE